MSKVTPITVADEKKLITKLESLKTTLSEVEKTEEIADLLESVTFSIKLLEERTK